MQTCPSCGAALPDRVVDTPVVKPSPPALPIPERWQVEAGPRSLVARWRWFGLSSFILVPFTLFWNGILLAMAGGVTEGLEHPERLLYALAVPHVWVGIGLVYFTLATFLNTTAVSAHHGRLTVKHGPMPWRGNQNLDGTDVKQLFVLEKRGNKGGLSYELCAMLRDGRKVSLVRGIEAAQARFLEVRLEQALGIQDLPVEGELHR